MQLQTEERLSDWDNHEWSAHHFPAAAQILDVGLDHIEQQGSVEGKVEFLQVNELQEKNTKSTLTEEATSCFSLTKMIWFSNLSQVKLLN